MIFRNDLRHGIAISKGYRRSQPANRLAGQGIRRICLLLFWHLSAVIPHRHCCSSLIEGKISNCRFKTEEFSISLTIAKSLFSGNFDPISRLQIHILSHKEIAHVKTVFFLSIHAFHICRKNIMICIVYYHIKHCFTGQYTGLSDFKINIVCTIDTCGNCVFHACPG